MKKTFRILSIDGGGIRGVIPARILQSIEEQTGHSCCDLFDLIAGTSTGGILAAGLTKPSLTNQELPQHSAKDMLEFYWNKGEIIFGKPARIKLAWNPKHDNKRIESVLYDTLDQAMLSDTLTNILVTAYEIEHRLPFFFNSFRAKDGEFKDSFDFKLADVARATSAAPVYFRPHIIKDDDLFVHKWSNTKKGYEKKKVSQYALIDGGVFANNPAMCAYVEMQKQALLDDVPVSEWPKVIVVSVGTGIDTKPIKAKDVSGSGLAWINPWKNVPIMASMFDGMPGSVHHQMRNLFGTYTDKSAQNLTDVSNIPDDQLGLYIRLDPHLPDSQQSIDDCSESNIKGLQQTAEGLLSLKAPELKGICKLLASTAK